MLRASTLADLEALAERVGALRGMSTQPERVDKNAAALEAALRQKRAQLKLEIAAVRRTIKKNAVGSALKGSVGDLAEVDYRERSRLRRDRVRDELQRLLAGGAVTGSLRADIAQHIEALDEMDQLEVVTFARALSPGSDEEDDDAPSEPVRRLPPLSQKEREASLQREFRRLDPDGNGHIEPAELLARLLETEAGQAAELTMRDVTLVINRLDGFAGQKDGVLEKGEFAHGMTPVVRVTEESVINRFLALHEEVRVEEAAAAVAAQAREEARAAAAQAAELADE